MIAVLATLAWAADPMPVVITDPCVQEGSFTGGGLTELSGLAFSRTSERIYAINDSGDSSRFFVTSTAGTPIQIVAVSGSTPSDTEDLAVGPCLGGGDCIFIGDIGDNDSRRGSLRLTLIAERTSFPSPVTPMKWVTMKYSDGRAHNAESLAVHPVTGDVFILTKTDSDPHIYRLSSATLAAAKNGATVTVQDVGTIDFDVLFGPTDDVMTGMAISPDGKRFSTLADRKAYEFDFDLSAWQTAHTSQLLKVRRVEYRVLKLKQQEAIAYSPSGGLFYATETGSSGTPSPLMRIPNIVPADPVVCPPCPVCP